MSEAIVKSEIFEEYEIRIFNVNGINMMPLSDIAKNIEYDRSTLRRVIENNAGFFDEGCQGVVPAATPGGIQELHCLTRDGVIALFMALNINRVKNEIKKQHIMKFRKWAIETLGKVMDNKVEEIKPFSPATAQPTKPSIGQLVSDQLQIADAMARYAHVDRGIATSMALSKVEFDTGEDLKMWKNMIPKEKVNKPIGLLTPTELGKQLGFGTYAGASINNVLCKLGFLQKIGTEWALTQKGDLYAEAYPVTGIGKSSGKSYSRYQLKWQPRIIEILRKHLFEPAPDINQGLLTGY